MISKTEISNELGIDRKTLNNWEKNRPELFKIVTDHFDNKESTKNCNDVNYLKEEIFKALDKLLENQVKMYYHLMMAELAKNGH